jgi:hypothetical protein
MKTRAFLANEKQGNFSKCMFGCMNWGLELPIWNLEARILRFGWSWNLSLETNQNSEPNPPCVISALHISELSGSELAGIVKTSKN